MMLEHLGHPDAAKAVVDAIETILVEGPRTPDAGGKAKTVEMGKAIAEAV
jgi:tartrate dehydrogenase/decarboxylase/D-malate dehydrogenase